MIDLIDLVKKTPNDKELGAKIRNLINNKMNTDIVIKRSSYSLNTTIGDVYLGGSKEKFCYSLEDTVRGEGIKIPGETAIPNGVYNWHITFSNRFKRDMISIYTEPNGYELKSKGISFKGLRIHGGNKSKDTHGCPLVAYRKLDADTIQGTAEKDLLNWAKSVGGKGVIKIINL
jgi:hypothetical protein